MTGLDVSSPGQDWHCTISSRILAWIRCGNSLALDSSGSTESGRSLLFSQSSFSASLWLT